MLAKVIMVCAQLVQFPQLNAYLSNKSASNASDILKTGEVGRANGRLFLEQFQACRHNLIPGIHY
jgi:hypothetical protein